MQRMWKSRKGASEPSKQRHGQFKTNAVIDRVRGRATGARQNWNIVTYDAGNDGVAKGEKVVVPNGTVFLGQTRVGLASDND